MKRVKQKYDRPTYDEMNRLQEEWIRNPVGSQADFFREYGWSRNEFFDEDSRRLVE